MYRNKYVAAKNTKSNQQDKINDGKSWEKDE